jgi:Cu+-exporting ATPase
LEALAKGETGDVIKKLVQIAATNATLLVDYTVDSPTAREEVVDINLIQRGDVVKVLPATRIPTDGKVVFGSSSVDQSMVTGEAAPVPKQVDDLVYSGTLNQYGLLHVKVTCTAAENTLSSITKMVQEAQNSKPPIERIADRIASYFVPVVLVLAIIVFVVWLGLASTGVVSPDSAPVTFALRFAIATLVISCPCAIGLAVPTAVMAGSGVGAKHGVLFKSGAVMEMCARVNAVVFDKTGTLTVGRPKVSSYLVLGEEGPEFWFWLGSVESASEHPLAQALVHFAKEKLASAEPMWQSFETPGAFSTAPGKGVTCSIDASDLCVGTFRWMQENNVVVSAAADEKLRLYGIEHGTTNDSSVYVAVDGALSAVIYLADAPRTESREVIARLHMLQVDVWMCSGDTQSTASAIATQVGLSSDRVLGGQLPQDKLALIRRLQSEGKTVAMVGDGINDSPSLSQADVGIAVAQGTDIAAEAADIMLMKDDLHGVLFTIQLAKRTLSCIKWNFTWAFLYNLLAVPIAMGIYYPAGGVSIPPALAGLSELLSSLPVVLFSLLLRYYKPSAPALD